MIQWFRLREGVELQERERGNDEDQELLHEWRGGDFSVDVL